MTEPLSDTISIKFDPRKAFHENLIANGIDPKDYAVFVLDIVSSLIIKESKIIHDAKTGKRAQIKGGMRRSTRRNIQGSQVPDPNEGDVITANPTETGTSATTTTTAPVTVTEPAPSSTTTTAPAPVPAPAPAPAPTTTTNAAGISSSGVSTSSTAGLQLPSADTTAIVAGILPSQTSLTYVRSNFMQTTPVSNTPATPEQQAIVDDAKRIYRSWQTNPDDPKLESQVAIVRRNMKTYRFSTDTTDSELSTIEAYNIAKASERRYTFIMFFFFILNVIIAVRPDLIGVFIMNIFKPQGYNALNQEMSKECKFVVEANRGHSGERFCDAAFNSLMPPLRTLQNAMSMAMYTNIGAMITEQLVEWGIATNKEQTYNYEDRITISRTKIRLSFVKALTLVIQAVGMSVSTGEFLNESSQHYFKEKFALEASEKQATIQGAIQVFTGALVIGTSIASGNAPMAIQGVNSLINTGITTYNRFQQVGADFTNAIARRAGLPQLAVPINISEETRTAVTGSSGVVNTIANARGLLSVQQPPTTATTTAPAQQQPTTTTTTTAPAQQQPTATTTAPAPAPAPAPPQQPQQGGAKLDADTEMLLNMLIIHGMDPLTVTISRLRLEAGEGQDPTPVEQTTTLGGRKTYRRKNRSGKTHRRTYRN